MTAEEKAREYCDDMWGSGNIHDNPELLTDLNP